MKTALADLIEAQMARYSIPGLSLAVVRRGVVKSSAYGLSSIELDQPATRQSVFQIASVSKIFSAIAAMLLVEQGKLSLDAPVGDLLPGSPLAWTSMRVHHLLSHTSGLPEVSRNPRCTALREARRDVGIGDEKLDTLTPDEIIDLLAELPLTFAPGSHWAYGQTGFILFGMIVERLSGLSFPTYVDKHVLEPLGITSAHFGDSRVVVLGRPSAAYSRQSGILRHRLWPFATTDYPAAGLNISAPDLAKLFQALDGGRLLASASLQRMWAPEPLANGTFAKYALGWNVSTVLDRRCVGHEGGGCCWVLHFPDDRLSVIVLSNLAGARADDLPRQIAALYL
jgi:D-alanyl-D-alanine carboxypeptidase